MTAKEAVKKSEYFNLDENWGDIENVDPDSILALDNFREYCGVKFHISPVKGAVFATSGHSEKSWHKIIPGRNKTSRAFDFFPEGDPLQVFISAVCSKDWGGVGYYPFYSYARKDGILQGAVHVDTRPYTLKMVWWVDISGKYHLWLDADNFRQMACIVNIGTKRI